MSKRIVVIGWNITLQRYLSELGDVMQFDACVPIPEDILESASLVVFTGGPDIDPDIYDSSEGRHKYTRTGNMRRDRIEVDVFDICKQAGVPMLGICRGAQLLCALSGGKVVQSITGHVLQHDIELWDYDKNKFVLCPDKATSTHSQMMYPFSMDEIDYYCLGKPPLKLSTRYERGPNVQSYSDVPYEPEILYFPFTECLSIQGHPEYDAAGKHYKKYCMDLIKQHMNLSVKVPEQETK